MGRYKDILTRSRALRERATAGCAAAPAVDAQPDDDRAMPELAAACRVLLRTVGLEQRWTDRGPDAQARAWLAAGDSADDQPAQLTPDQWTMLRVCWGLWRGAGGPVSSELSVLRPASLASLSSYWTALALGAADDWPTLF